MPDEEAGRRDELGVAGRIWVLEHAVADLKRDLGEMRALIVKNDESNEVRFGKITGMFIGLLTAVTTLAIAALLNLAIR